MTERDIFFEAIEITNADERDAYLRGACGKDVSLRRKVDALLTEHFANDSLLQGPAVEGRPTEVEATPVSECAGSVIGRYKLLQKIGEGGFGVVYMAEQKEPVKRRVALKIIKLGMDTKQVVARFEAERQALAMMDHPNIAKVLDAGATDTGRPYFVMELVKGIPMTKYCDENNLTTEERLNLFMDVCSAIQHAHQKGIIHRDIKPSNILITLHDGRPVPKVIDFGIAKATQQELTEKTLFTQFSQFIGTPAYMSPEQAEMSGLDIDTRSDIYSLGVLFYELLTGRTPLDSKELMSGGYDEIRRRIREEEPSKPSTRVSTMEGDERTDVAKHRRTESTRLSHQLRGDLDWIAMKALEKDRTRRYETANALKLDIQRFLENEPVSAVAPSVGYKFHKFVRRNKVTFAATTGIAAALVIGITTASWQTIQAKKHARIAEKRTVEALEARQIEQEQRELAQQHARTADEARAEERRQRYVGDIAVVNDAIRDLDTVLGYKTLENHIPTNGEPDLRGWEWRYLYGRFARAKASTRVMDAAHEIAVSPDGMRIAVGGLAAGEQAIAVLSFPDLKPQQLLSRPHGWIPGMWFTEDSRTLVLEKHQIMQYDLSTGDSIGTVDNELVKGSWPFVLSRDRRWGVGGFTTTDGRRVLRCVDIQRQEVVGSTESFRIQNTGMRDHILRMAPDGSAVAEGYAGDVLRIYAVPDLEELHSIQMFGSVSVVAWSHDGNRLATSYDQPYQVDLWDAKSGGHIGTLPDNFYGPGFDLVFSPDGSLLAGCDWGNIVSVWNTRTLEMIHTYTGDTKGRIPALTFHPDNRTLISVGDSGNVFLWDAAPPEESELEMITREEKLFRFQFAPDGRTLAALNPDGAVVIFDIETEKLLTRLPRPQPDEDVHQIPLFRWTPQLAYSTDGNTLVAADGGSKAVVYDVPSGRLLHVLEGHPEPLINVRLSPDGNLICTTGQEKTAILWDTLTGRKIRQIDGVDMADFHPNPENRLMAVIYYQNDTITLIDIDTGVPHLHDPLPLGDVWSLGFGPNGNMLAVGVHQGVRLFSMPDLKPITSIDGLRGPTPMVAFHPDGHTLAIPTWGGTCKLWNTNVSAIVASMEVPRDEVVTAHFSPDGNTLAVSTVLDGIQLFRAPSMREIELERQQGEQTMERISELAVMRDAQVRRDREQRFANDPGSINQWLLLGPIPRQVHEDLDDQHLPNEAALQPREGERVQLPGGVLVWESVIQRDPVFDFHRIYLSMPAGTDNKSVYAVCYLHCNRALDQVIVKMGNDDGSILYLNGREIHRDPTRHAHVLDQHEIAGIQLNAGVNRLVFRVDNGKGEWVGSVRLMDKDGNRLEGVRVTLNPDE